MAAFTKFKLVADAIARGLLDWNSDTFKVALTNVAPNADTNYRLSDITELSAGNGYLAGGLVVANTTLVTSAGVAALSGDDVQFVAAGGPIGPFRYAVLYDDTTTDDLLVGFWDRGSSITLSDSDRITVVFDLSILTLQ